MKLSQLAALAAVFASAGAAAQTVVPQSALIPSTNYYTDVIGGGIGATLVTTGGSHAANVGQADGRNDDGFTGPIDLGFTLNFFGQNYTSFYANNNGNISFTNGISAYVPTGPIGATSPVISPWFGDVDTRGTASGTLHLRTDIPNEIILTWDQVGYYDGHDDKLNSFQLVVRGPGYAIPTGEGAIGFFYKGMQWEDTDTSNVAAVGFGDGAGQGEVLQGSTQAGLYQAVANHHIWFDAQLAPVPQVPEPESIAMLAAGLGVVALVVRRRRQQKA